MAEGSTRSLITMSSVCTCFLGGLICSTQPLLCLSLPSSRHVDVRQRGTREGFLVKCDPHISTQHSSTAAQQHSSTAAQQHSSTAAQQHSTAGACMRGYGKSCYLTPFGTAVFFRCRPCASLIQCREQAAIRPCTLIFNHGGR